MQFINAMKDIALNIVYYVKIDVMSLIIIQLKKVTLKKKNKKYICVGMIILVNNYVVHKACARLYIIRYQRNGKQIVLNLIMNF